MLDVEENEQQRQGQAGTTSQASMGAAMVTPPSPGVMVIEPPTANERRIIDLNSAQKVTFGFTLADISVSIVDVDVILIFANGGRLILPSFMLSMIAAEPPQLVFSGLLTDPQNIIAAAGEVRLVDQLPQLTLSDNARPPMPGQATSPSPEPPAPPAPQVVQMTASQSFASTPAPAERTRESTQTDPDNSATGSLRRTTSLAAEQQNQSLKGEGALTERSDKVDSQTGNVIQKDNAVPSITSDGGGDSAALAVDENSQQVTTVTATDPNGTDVLVYAISGGRDADKFAINSRDGKLYFIAAPDFENPDPASGAGIYEVDVQVSDGRDVDTQKIAVTVRNINEAPTGATLAGGTLAENSAPGTNVGSIAGIDPDAGDVLSYAFAPNGDASGRFAIDAASGLITLLRGDLIDFEASDRQLVIVRVTDSGGLSHDTPIILTILDANDAPEITSNGGGTSAGITIAENTSIITTVIATDEDAGSVVRYAIAGGIDAASFSIDAVTGVITFQATPDFERPADANLDNVYLIVVQASDGIGGIDQQALTITVVNSNDAPTDITLSGTRVSENALNGTLIGTATGEDPDENSTLRYSLAPGGDGGGRFAINALTGALTVADGSRLDFESSAAHLIIIRATDQGGLSVDRAFTITLDDVNEAPVIIANGGGDTATINHAENLSGVGQIIARDPEGAAIAYSIVGGVDAGLFVIDPVTGVLSFVQPPNFEAPQDADGNNAYDVIVQASDGTFNDSQTLTILVNDTGEPPIIISNGGGALASVTINEGQTAVSQIIASDPDAGAVISYSIAGGADAARFVINGATGSLSLVAAADFESPNDSNGDNIYQVIVQASDGILLDQQTIVLTVLNVNDAPEITSDGGGSTANLQASEGILLVTTITATDPDLNATLFFAITGGADAGRFSLNSVTGQLRFLSAPDFELPGDAGGDNTYNVIVQVLDGLGGTDTQAIAVTVTNQNEAPVITSNGGLSTASINVNENAAAVGTVTATDADTGAVLSYSIAGGADAARFAINSATGALTFVAAPDFEAPSDVGGNNIYDVIVQVSDGLGGTDTQAIAVTVANQNEAPVITSDGGGTTASTSAPEGSIFATTVTAVDQDAGNTLTYTIVGGADQTRFTINPATGVLTFIAAPNFEAPTDAGGDNIYDVVVQVADGLGGTDTQAIAVTVTNQNEAPVITSNGGLASASVTVNENAATVSTVTATDVDVGAVLSYSIAGGADAARFAINSATGALTFVASPDFEAPSDIGGNNVYDVIVQVSDGLGGTDTQAIAVTVTNQNEAPVITSDGGLASAALSVQENGSSVTTVAASDPDTATTFIYTIVGGADQARFTINPANGVLTFVSAPNFEVPSDVGGNNVYDVIVQASDGLGGTDTQAIAVTVTNQNEAPEITSNGGGATATATMSENSTAVITMVTATDPDAGATRTFSIVGGADGALFAINAATGALSFASGTDFEAPSDAGSDSIYDVIVQVSDGLGGADTQAIAVSVTNLNEAPVITSDGSGATATINRTEGASVSVTTITASDPDAGATRTFAIIGGSDAARFTIDASSGMLNFVANPDFEAPADADANNSYSVVVQVSDGLGGIDTQAITVNIGNLNEAPTALSLINVQSLAENVAVGTGLKIADIVVTDDALGTETITLGGADAALFEIRGSEIYFIGTSPDFETQVSYSLTVVVDDTTVGATPELSANLVINVINANEAPTGIALAGPQSVTENMAGATIGAITVSDPDAGNTFTYAVSDTRFEVTGGNLQLKSGQSINRELEASVTLDVTAIDQGGLSVTRTFTITIADADEFDVTAPVDANAAANAVTENVAIGTIIGITASASDADATTNAVTYAFAPGGNPLGLFAIDAATGVVTTAAAIDREALGANVTITIRATSADGSVADAGFTIAINDVNESGVSAVSDTNATADTITENSAIGTAVGITAFASDPDVTTNAITYSLDDSAGGLFAIDAATGVITTNAAIDREALGASAAITVRATSADGSSSTQGFTIAIADADEFDVTAPVDANAAANAVTENVAIGTIIGITASASDADATTNAVTYAFAPGGNPLGLFAIDAATGVVTTAAAIDREALGANVTITIRATSADGSVADAGFTIAINDVNESGVSAVSDTNAAADTITENSAIGTAVGITAFASDPDVTTNAITYSLDDSAGGLFAIDAATGVITTNAAIDREALGASAAITVRATSADGSSSTQGFTIAIADADEFDVTAPVDANAAANAVTENIAIGTVIGITASASDADATTNAITYAFAPGGNPLGLFAIDAATGVVTTAAAIDREALGANVTITIRATSADGSVADAGFTIAINDVNESGVSAVSDTNAAADTITENSAIGTAVGITAFASDADVTTNAITYSLDDSAGGLFAIDAATGVITTNAAIDREALGASAAITVRATSADGSSSTQGFTIAIADADEFDVTAPVDANAAANAVTENVAIGTIIGITASASDADATTNAVTYAFAPGGNPLGLFAIDAATGVVTTAAAIDREALGANVTITIRATSADGSVADAGFTIAINDVNESGVSAVSDTNAAADTITENSAIGTAVGITAFASDADVTTNAITYSLDDSAGGLFAIDAATGVITTNAAIDREALGASAAITVRATSADGSSSTQGFTIAIADADEFDVTAPVDANAAANAVTENVAIGTIIGITASASDADATTNAVTYAFAPGGNPLGLFAIDAATGVVTTAAAIDREALGANVTITIRATSADGSVADAGFTIAINDVNESGVSAVSDTNATADTITENSAIGTAVGITAFASDPDVTTNAITYSLDDSAGGLFAIDAATGVITTNAAIDREALGASAAITVRATSADGSSSTQGFTIAIADADEFDVTAPVDANAAANAVTENVAIGTIIGITASASDADATTNAVTYAFAPGGNPLGLFAIDAATGVVTTAAAIDREALGANVTITIRATSADGSVADAGFTIAINDVNDNGPLITSDGGAASASISSAENTAIVTTVTASDPDTVGIVNFSITGGADAALFTINITSGVLAFLGTPNFEAPTDAGADNSYDVIVSVSDGTFTDDQAIAVIITNQNEAPAITSHGGVAVHSRAVSENTTPITTVTAADPDAATTLTYSISGGLDASFFNVNSATGELSLVAPLDFETPLDSNDNNIYQVTVRASDGVIFAEQTIQVTIADVNEAPVITSDGGAASAAVNVAENSTGVTTVTATDADAGATIIYSIEGGADAASFAINAMTGVLTFVSAPDYEAPADAGGDNVYDVIVRASDGVLFEDQALAVTVTDEAGFFSGTTGADTYGGTAENDAIAGLAGNDTLSGGASDDTIDGGSDIDIAVFSGSRADYQITTLSGTTTVVDLRGAGFDGTDTVTATETFRFSDGDIDLANINDIGGTAGNDNLTAPSASGHVLLGRAGDDALTGSAGNDRIIGGDDSDTLIGGAGNDRINGGDGNDSLTGGSGNDNLIGGTSDDVLSGDDGNDILDGGEGNDELHGGTGNDVIDGGAGDDTVVGGIGADTLTGGGGSDELSYASSATGVSVDLQTGIASGGDADGDVIGANDFTRLTGSAHNDALTGTASANTINGGDGADMLVGSGGSGDVLNGDGGNDTLDASDSLSAILSGGSGNDLLVLDTAALEQAGTQANGGTGDDILVLRDNGSSNPVLEVAFDIVGKVSGVEQIDATGTDVIADFRDLTATDVRSILGISGATTGELTLDLDLGGGNDFFSIGTGQFASTAGSTTTFFTDATLTTEIARVSVI